MAVLELRDTGGTKVLLLSTPAGPGGGIAPIVAYYRRKRGAVIKLLRQSTSVDVGIGPFVDATDGVTPEIALTITQPDIRLKKGAAAWAQKNAAQTLSHEENGWYEVTLDATDTGTLGMLTLAVHEAGAVPVFHEFLVLPANVYDSWVAGSDTLDVQVTGLGASVITAASIAADAITDAKVASDVTIASVTGSVGSVAGAVASVTAGVTVATNNDKTGYSLSAAGVQAIWDALTSALTTVGSIGKKLADWVIGTAQTGDAYARLGAPAGASVSADIAAVKAQTAAIEADTTVIGPTGGGLTSLATQASVNALPTAATIADAVWDEVLSGHLTGGSTGAALNGAGAAGDPWGTALPGAYAAGTAGKILGDNLNATVGSRATQTSVDTVDDFLDTEIAAIKAKTDNLPTDPADQSAVEAAITAATAGLATAAALTIVDDFLDTEVAAIKAKTDNLPASPAAVGSAMTLAGAEHTAIASDVVTGLTSQGYTSTRAGYLDTLNGLVANIWASVTRTLTSAANLVLAKGSGITGFNDLSAAQVNAEVDTALADYDAPTKAELDAAVAPLGVTAAKLDTALELDGAVYRYTVNALEQAPSGGGGGATAAEIADAVLEELVLDHDQVDGSLADYIVGLSEVSNVTVSAPIPQSDRKITLVTGDSYLTAEGRQLVWTVTGFTQSIVGASVLFTDGNFSKAASMVLNGTTLTITLELTSADTDTLLTVRSPRPYHLRITFANAHVETAVIGLMSVVPGL